MEIKNDPGIKRLLSRMPADVANSLTEEQLTHIRNAVGARNWGDHQLDIRGSFKLFRWRYYYVILAGKNRRQLSQEELKKALFINALLISVFVSAGLIFGFVVLYLIKSALGIDLFENYSLGLWTWFKTTFLSP